MEEEKGAAQRRKGRNYGSSSGERKKLKGAGDRWTCPKFTRLVRAVISPPPVASKDAASASKEANEKGDKGTKGEPVGISVLCGDPVVPEDVPGDSPKCHVDNPSNEGTDEGETRDEGHEYRPRTVVRSPAEAKDNGKTRETRSCTKRG